MSRINIMELMKNDHGSAFTVIDASSVISTGFPETIENAFLISTPAETISIGIKRAQKNPIIVCLYLILISRQVSI